MANKFKVGDRVRVVRKGKGWVEPMDHFMGNVYTIEDIPPYNQVEFYYICGWWFNEESLAPEPIRFKVGDLVRVVRKPTAIDGFWVTFMDDYVNDSNTYMVNELGNTAKAVPWVQLIFYSGPTPRRDSWYFPIDALCVVSTDQLPSENLEIEDIPGYTDSVDPEKAMQVLRSLCGKGSY